MSMTPLMVFIAAFLAAYNHDKSPGFVPLGLGPWIPGHIFRFFCVQGEIKTCTKDDTVQRNV